MSEFWFGFDKMRRMRRVTITIRSFSSSKFYIELKKGSEIFDVKGTPAIIFLNKEGIIEFVGNKLPEDYLKKLNTIAS